ncbi:unnamed protein product [Allacma fusca]|uniref:Uncharacterized protein n=1 Tax=Allacma fusca TaxID=39272 RepID=A0A8J2NRN6_9HEXA|nr:unnamed protein product [Allacma fusca]
MYLFTPLLIATCSVLVIGAADHHHINSVGIKLFPTGCRKKIGGNAILPGGAGLCVSLKPLKPAGILQMSKSICSEGWAVCSHKEKSLQQISWKPHKMPQGCFAFRFGKKDKAAGYGQDCHTNLYFNGVLCCPSIHNEKEYLKKHIALKTNRIH